MKTSTTKAVRPISRALVLYKCQECGKTFSTWTPVEKLILSGDGCWITGTKEGKPCYACGNSTHENCRWYSGFSSEWDDSVPAARFLKVLDVNYKQHVYDPSWGNDGKGAYYLKFQQQSDGKWKWTQEGPFKGRPAWM